MVAFFLWSSFLHARIILNPNGLIMHLCLINFFLYISFVCHLFHCQLHSTHLKKIGVLVRGESFRSGFQGSRDVCKPESRCLQKQATKSFYTEVINVWRSMGHMVYLYLDTYPSRGCEQELPLLYPDAVEIHIHPITNHPIVALGDALQRLLTAYPEIDAWFITRFDICYKPTFKEVARKISNEEMRILAPWRISVKWGDTLASGRDRICDTMFWVPSSLVLAFRKACNPYLNAHNFWDALAPVIGHEKLGYMVNGQAYDSDSSKEWNPYYFFVQRPEGPKSLPAQ
jgi:hypothetical protein